MSKANIFHHFGSKEELYLAVLQKARAPLTRHIAEMTQNTDAPLEQTLGPIADRYLKELLEHADLARLVIRETGRPIHRQQSFDDWTGPAHRPGGKNSILLVDLTNQSCKEGKSIDEALSEACPIRMRPVLMTSLTVILAFLPAALGY